MCEVQGEIPVVGQEEQPLAVFVEASDGMQVRPFLWEQVGHDASVQVVAASGQKPHGLVQGDVNLTSSFHRTPFDLDRVVVGVDLGAEFFDYRAIDLDEAVDNETFASAARSHASLGEKFLESDLHKQRKPSHLAADGFP